MTKITKTLTTSAVVAVFGLALLPGATYASTYDPNTNTISASQVSNPDSIAYGTYGFEGDSGSDIVTDSDIASDGLTVSGSIDDIRATLQYLYAYIDGGEVGSNELKAALASVSQINLNIIGDAELTPNDLGYVQFLERYVNGSTDPTTPVSAVVALSVDGNVTFADGTADFAGVSIADVTNNGGSGATVGPVTLTSTGTITIPDGFGSDITTFLGAAVIPAGNSVSSDGVAYTTTADNVFVAPSSGGDSSSSPAVTTLTSPNTGQASSSQLNYAALIILALAAASGSVIGLRRLSARP